MRGNGPVERSKLAVKIEEMNKVGNINLIKSLEIGHLVS